MMRPLAQHSCYYYELLSPWWELLLEIIIVYIYRSVYLSVYLLILNNTLFERTTKMSWDIATAHCSLLSFHFLVNYILQRIHFPLLLLLSITSLSNTNSHTCGCFFYAAFTSLSVPRVRPCSRHWSLALCCGSPSSWHCASAWNCCSPTTSGCLSSMAGFPTLLKSGW